MCAIRLARADASLPADARVARLAIELGELNEAERLYRRCGRYDLLNRMLQAAGRFDEALALAERHDRVHLRHTWWAYARWLRADGRCAEALRWYAKCGPAALGDVTQMLLAEWTAGELREHVGRLAADGGEQPELLRWYAQLAESTGDMQTALEMYAHAGDAVARVRILCFRGELAAAVAVAGGGAAGGAGADRAACFTLARHYETDARRPAAAVEWYRRARSVANVVRVCRELQMPDELWQCASAMARGREARVAAEYFEELAAEAGGGGGECNVGM